MTPAVVESLSELVNLLRDAPRGRIEISVWDEGAQCVEALVATRPRFRELCLSEESPETRAPLLASELLAALPTLEHLHLGGCPLRVNWSNVHHAGLRSLELNSTHGLPWVPLAAFPALERVVVSTFFPEPMDDGLNDDLKCELDVLTGHLRVSGTLHNAAHCSLEPSLMSRTSRASFAVSGNANVVERFKANVMAALGR